MPHTSSHAQIGENSQTEESRKPQTLADLPTAKNADKPPTARHEKPPYAIFSRTDCVIVGET
jgi:hypothetical protein